MYFWVAVMSMSCWAMHSILFAQFARKSDGISISFYRSISLLVTMMPILFLADFESLGAITENLWLFFIGGLLGAVAVIFFYESMKCLPIGIVVALDKMIVLVVLAMSYFIYGEVLDAYEAFGVAIILISIISLVFVKNKMPHLDNNILKGILLMIPRIIGAGIWFFVLGLLSNKVDFAISAYLMEAFSFVGILISIAFKYLFTGKHIIKMSLKDYSKLFIFSSLTLGGTGGYALAVSLGGPQGVIYSVLVTEIIFVSILGYFFYNEKLILKQWVFIFFTFVGLVMLKMSS